MFVITTIMENRLKIYFCCKKPFQTFSNSILHLFYTLTLSLSPSRCNPASVNMAETAAMILLIHQNQSPTNLLPICFTYHGLSFKSKPAAAVKSLVFVNNSTVVCAG